VNDRVTLGIVCKNLLFLVLLFLDSLLCLCLLVFVLLGQFIVFLFVLSLTDSCQTSLLTLKF
jgi:hypothetical protein